MLILERIQTLIGRQISAVEAWDIAKILGKEVAFMYTEESVDDDGELVNLSDEDFDILMRFRQTSPETRENLLDFLKSKDELSKHRALHKLGFKMIGDQYVRINHTIRG